MGFVPLKPTLNRFFFLIDNKATKSHDGSTSPLLESRTNRYPCLPNSEKSVYKVHFVENHKVTPVCV